MQWWWKRKRPHGLLIDQGHLKQRLFYPKLSDMENANQITALLSELQQERQQLQQLRDTTRDMARELRCIRALLFAKIQSAPIINVNAIHY